MRFVSLALPKWYRNAWLRSSMVDLALAATIRLGLLQQSNQISSCAPPSARFTPRSHGLMDVSVPPRAPELIGSWMLYASGSTPDTTINDERVVLENDVFIAAANTSSSTRSTSGERSLMRLPPARAGGVLEVSLGGPPAPTLKGAQEVWGFSLRVNPLFPSDFGGAHPWLVQRFEAFTALVWGEQGHAHASNIELVRYGYILYTSIYSR